MSARHELDLLTDSHPAILDRAAEVMDKAEEERVMQFVPRSSRLVLRSTLDGAEVEEHRVSVPALVIRLFALNWG